MLEKDIEKKFTRDLKRLGCLVYKFESPSSAGVPDRLCITESGRVVFVELKRPQGRLSERQKVVIEDLKKHNAEVYVLYSIEEVEKFIKKVEEDERRKKTL